MNFSELWNIAENHTELAEPPCIAVASAECGSSSGSSISRYSVWPWKCVLLLSLLSCFDSQQLLWQQLWAEHTSHTTASKLLPLRPNPNSNNYAFSAAPSFRSLLLKNFSPPSVRPHFFRLKSPTTKLTRDKLKPLNTASASKEAEARACNQAKLLIAKMTNKFLLQNELLQWTIMVVRWLCRKIHTGYQTRFCYGLSLFWKERQRQLGYLMFLFLKLLLTHEEYPGK